MKEELLLALKSIKAARARVRRVWSDCGSSATDCGRSAWLVATGTHMMQWVPVHDQRRSLAVAEMCPCALVPARNALRFQ